MRVKEAELFLARASVVQTSILLPKVALLKLFVPRVSVGELVVGLVQRLEVIELKSNIRPKTYATDTPWGYALQLFLQKLVIVGFLIVFSLRAAAFDRRCGHRSPVRINRCRFLRKGQRMSIDRRFLSFLLGYCL